MLTLRSLVRFANASPMLVLFRYATGITLIPGISIEGHEAGPTFEQILTPAAVFPIVKGHEAGAPFDIGLAETSLTSIECDEAGGFA